MKMKNENSEKYIEKCLRLLERISKLEKFQWKVSNPNCNFLFLEPRKKWSVGNDIFFFNSMEWSFLNMVLLVEYEKLVQNLAMDIY